MSDNKKGDPRVAFFIYKMFLEFNRQSKLE